MMRTMTLLAFLILTATALADTTPGQSSADYVEPVELDEILLTDGNLLTGRLIEEHEDYVIFETDTLGRMEILRSNIERIARSGERAGVMVDPDYNSLMFCPTPATLAKGDSYFRDFELFFLNFGSGITDAFDLSIGTLFPISSEVIMVSVGGKLRLIDREEGPIGLALIGSYTKLEDVSFSAVGAVAGVGNKRSSFNVMINRTSDDDGDSETVFIIGGDTEWSAADETQRENLITLCRDPDCLTCGRGELYHGQGDEGRRAVGGRACDRVDFVVGGHDGGVVDVLAVIPGS